MIEKYLPLAPNSSIPPPIERLYFVTHFTTVGRKDKEALGYTEEGKFSNFGPTANLHVFAKFFQRGDLWCSLSMFCLLTELNVLVIPVAFFVLCER